MQSPTIERSADKIVIKLEKTFEVESPPRPTTLQDLMGTRPPNTASEMDTDTKPDINGYGHGEDKARVEAVGIKPIYGFEGCPSFPPKWTYATPDTVRPLRLAITAVLMTRTMWWMIRRMDRSRNGLWTLLN